MLSLFVFFLFISILVSILLILVSVAFITLLERKILALAQSRVGPSKIILKGVLQPLIDGVKLLCKSMTTPIRSFLDMLFLASVMVMVIMVFTWSCLLSFPFHSFYWVGIFMFMAVLGAGVYGIFLIGYSAASKYSFVGGIRSCSQTISYEVSLVFIIFCVVLVSSSFSFLTVQGMIWIMFPFWIISCLSEVNRAPFDLAEGESELISGFNIELAGFPLAYIFVGEYGMLVSFSWFTSMIFWGCSIFFVVGFLSLFLLMRVSFPRFRYDKLMKLCWTSLLPCILFISWSLVSVGSV